MAAETKSNLIDITHRLKKGRSNAKGTKGPAQSNKEVVQVPVGSNLLDMTARRSEIIQSERRHVQRTVLSQFIGAFVVLPTKGLQSVQIHDISEGGLSFDLPLESGKFGEGETIALRIYLSHDLYFPFTAKVANVRPAEGEGCFRHGATFEKGQASSDVIKSFVKFLEGVATISRRDNGDRVIGKVE